MPTLDNSPGDMFRFYAKRRRLPRWGRLVMALVVMGVIYLFTIQRVHTSTLAKGLSEGVTSRSSPLHETLQDVSSPAQDGQKQPVRDQTGEPAAPLRAGKSKADIPAVDNKPARLDRLPEDTASRSSSPGRPDSKLDQGLKYICSLYPDELHVRELLRPIENSGKERMRELGLRARQFRKLLESWEDIHLVHTKDSVMVRDDIIPYLSQLVDTTGISAHKSRAEIIHSYENFRYFLTKLSEVLFPWTAPYFADHMTLHASLKHGGRGIVLSGGDGQLKYMMTSIRSIRALGCDLPIEVMYLGDDDLGDDSRSELEGEDGVITRDMKQMVHDEGWDLRGWAGKPFAILLSSFREVIFIDADAMFFSNPANLFDDPSYEETGTLFFRDRLMFPESKRKWLQQILPKPMSRNVRASRFWTGESGHMQESGVVLVDKWRHFMAMLMVTRMNGPDRDGNEEQGIIGTYDMVYGDKETFWLGWELVGDTDYAFHPGEAGNMGVAKADYNEAREWVLGNIVDAQKKAQEEEEQRKLEEARRQEEEEARKKEAAEALKEKKAAMRRKAQEEKQAAEALKKAEEASKVEEAKATPSLDTADPLPEKEQEDPTGSGPGKAKQYNSPPSPVEADTMEPGTDTLDQADGPANGAQRTVADVNAAGKPATQQDSADSEQPARRVKRAVEEEKPVLDSLSDSLGSDKASHLLNPPPRGDEFSICSPQLLHLGRDNRPLWFNGWILDNKFDQDHPRLSTFESFMLERKVDALEADWKLEESNLCCLTSDKVYEFTKKEKQALKRIVEIAKGVGAVGRQGAWQAR